MRQDVNDNFSLNVSLSKMKRIKRFVLEKLKGSYIDEFNKFEGYAQELGDSNLGTDAIINISKEALEQGKKRFLRMYICIQDLKNGWKGGLRPFIGLDELTDGEGVTFMSDMQKGLMDVVTQVFSKAHYRWCVNEEITMVYPAQRWCRAYLDTICKNQGCDNNFTESFNKWILKARAQPIIKMFKNIRIKVMNRLKEVEEEGRKWKENFSPYAMNCIMIT
ncbi:hypothetical protein P3S68_016330 [Capsicum galapagoense]